MAKTSIKAAVRDAVRVDTKLRKSMLPDGSATSGVKSLDSFVNFSAKMGVGADNPLTAGTYGFNPISRQRTLLEWIHRGSWLGGVAVDVVADDMTRQGIEYTNELPPDDSEILDHDAVRWNIWGTINETIKWSRLYGGACAVLLIDGQDMRTPLRLDTIGEGQFKGLLALDRWMVEPSVEDLVTDFGPQLGLPKFYRVGSNAPALRGQAIHYSRLAFRLEGVKLPYQQRLTENLWGISVLERLYDRMIAFDSASTGAAQLVYKAYLRTLSIDGLREVVSAGGPAMDGLVKYTEMMRRFQGIEGITLIDGKDKFEAQAHGAFSGLSDILTQFALQLSGALQIPLTRLFGQSPGGLNAAGDNEMRNYYDHIKQRQEADLHVGVTRIYKCISASNGLRLPSNFGIGFKSLWQLTETDKSNIAKTNTETVLSAKEAGIISDQVVLQELRQTSRITGVFTNITTELIDAADTELEAPIPDAPIDPATGLPVPVPGMPPGADPTQPGEPNEEAGSQGAPGAVAPRQVVRKQVQQPAPVGSPPG